MSVEDRPSTIQETVNIRDLRAIFDGRVIAPDDDAYDKARTIFYGKFDRRPAAIIRAADAADVARVVSFARENKVELAVRSGGHSLAGHSASEGGIVLDLGAMRGLQIDAQERTAWAEAGLTAGEYTEAAAKHDLATGFGDSGSVGIGGITLGGGIGFISRKHGLTIDSLLAAEIVTADGEIRYVDADTHPDLFWAIRGGGGNFGVVTRFQFRLHEVGEILGGMLILPATPDVIASFVAEAQAAPDELTTIANVAVAPPAPFIPQDFHGKLILFTILCYAGDAGAGERAIAPFRALAEPIVDMVRSMPYPQIYVPDQEGEHPVVAGRNFFIDRFGREQAQTILDHLARSDAPVRMVQLRVLGGAVGRVPNDATAFAHRDRPIMSNAVALASDPRQLPTYHEWAINLATTLSQGRRGAYANFMDEESPDRVRAAYPGATWNRLVEIKDRYDPTNLFRLNQNIPPSSARSL